MQLHEKNLQWGNVRKVEEFDEICKKEHVNVQPCTKARYEWRASLLTYAFSHDLAWDFLCGMAFTWSCVV